MNNTEAELKDYYCYFPVTPWKFCLMSICTLGLYEFYWSYKNWQYIKTRDGSGIRPVWRSVFYPFWYYAFLSDLARNHAPEGISNKAYMVVLAIGLLILSYIWKAPDPYWLLSIFTFVPMLPAVFAISKINGARPEVKKRAGHKPLNFVAYLIGGPIMVFSILLSIGFFPSTMVVTGDSLWERDLRYLRNQEILAEDEDIIYFYSGGVLSIKEDGQFISEDYVTSYGMDPEDGIVYSAFAAYEDIERVDVKWSTSLLEDTVITISDVYGNEFELWVSSESGGDKKFVKELKRLWNMKRAAPPGTIAV
ncbi:hypothetical protein [Marinobacter sp. F3R11]|uniref:hypothetical protein n=1 Tax=Marinobacter sp. F3R11 TaxID=2267231 RepID=UPI0011E5F2A8|nr:hypothetical protein [Marinobacter sp. F3R11]